MTKSLLINTFCFLVIAQTVLSQEIFLTDSIFIPENTSLNNYNSICIIPQKNAFCVTDYPKFNIYKYDYTGKYIHDFQDTNYKNIVKRPFTSILFPFSYSNSLIIVKPTPREDYIFEYDKNLHFTSITPVNYSKKIRYYCKTWGIHVNRGIFWNGQWFSPVYKVSNGIKPYYLYQDYIIGLFVKEQEKYVLKCMYGKFSAAYKQKLIPYLNDLENLTIDTVQKRLFISQEAVPDIQIWDIKSGKHITTLKNIGKHINPDYNIPQAWNKKTDNSIRLDYSPEIQKRIECTVYKNLYYDHNTKFLYRIYTIGKKDTVRHHKKNKQEWKEYKKKNGRTCGSPLPEIIANQVRLEQSKPYGLQIYNEKYELIFDEIMPTPFNILKIENNEIWVHGRYDEVNQKYWIYKYRIETK